MCAVRVHRVWVRWVCIVCGCGACASCMCAVHRVCVRWVCIVCVCVGASPTFGLLRIFLALCAYFNVLRVSSNELSAGEMQAIITVRLLPPKESCSNSRGGNREAA
jgi:hypothetical protein